MQSMGPQSVQTNLMTEHVQRRGGILSHSCRAHIIIKKKKKKGNYICLSNIDMATIPTYMHAFAHL